LGNRSSFLITIALILAYVIFICVTGSNDYWYHFAFLMCILQFHIVPKAALLFPLIACLTLSEFYFVVMEKRVYLCELLFYPLVVNYFFILNKKRIDKIWGQLILLCLLITFFQALNFLFYSDFTASFFRVRTLVFPVIIIGIVVNLVKSKEDLKRMINLVIIVSMISVLVVFMQFITGKFYVLQTEEFLNSDEKFFLAGYLESTADSLFFQLFGLKIKGPIPPVGLNYYKFGFSEKIIMPMAICASLALYSKKRSKKYLLVALFAAQFVATLLTGSRSVLVTALCIVFVLILFYTKKFKWRLIEGTIAFFFLVIYFIAPFLTIIGGEELGTLASRVFYLDEFFKYIYSNPMVLITGSNADAFIKFSNAEQPPHHFIAFGIISDGLIITLVIVTIIFILLKRITFFTTLDKEILAIGYGLWAGIFGFIFVYGQTSYLTWAIPHNMYFLFMIGLLIAVYRITAVPKLRMKNLSLLNVS